MRRVGLGGIECKADARLWEIAENLHRAELKALERDEHLAEWIRLTEEKQKRLQSVQSAPIESKRADGRGHRRQGGISAAARDLSVDPTDAKRAVKTDSLSPEAKEAARAAHLDNNRSVLLDAARQKTPDRQVAHIEAERQRREMEKANRDTNAVAGMTAAEEFAEWIDERLNASELPVVLSWLEAARPRDVAAALRRRAA